MKSLRSTGKALEEVRCALMEPEKETGLGFYFGEVVGRGRNSAFRGSCSVSFTMIYKRKTDFLFDFLCVRGGGTDRKEAAMSHQLSEVKWKIK